MKNWRHTQRKRDLNWAQALRWQMMLPPESRNQKLVQRLKKEGGGVRIIFLCTGCMVRLKWGDDNGTGKQYRKSYSEHERAA